MSTKHKNYYEIEAKSYYELGQIHGKLFRWHLKHSIDYQKKNENFLLKSNLSKLYLEATKKYYPNIFDELSGQADGANQPLLDIFTLAIEDELTLEKNMRCTTVVTNGGNLISHNEDWDAESLNEICLLKKTVNGLSIFEFFYIGTLGGNSISINSHGLIQTINSLSHYGKQIGVPKNIISRSLSESKTTEDGIGETRELERSSGYHHLLLPLGKDGISYECTENKVLANEINYPFVHTNHYLSDLREFEKEKIDYSLERYKFAVSHVEKQMSEESLIKVMSDRSLGKRKSLFNERTIGRMVINRETKIINVWMLREDSKGWVEYPLNQIFKTI